MAEIVDFGLQQHKIKMDSRYFENVLSVVAGDTGRRIEVQLLDTNGMVQDTTGLNLRLNAEIAGKATFTDATLVDAATGKYQLDLSNGMFLAPGNWQFQWQITDSAGKKLHSFAFTGNIGKNISEGGSQATNFYLNLEDLKKMQDDLINGTIDSSILETTITEKLTDLETQYAPRLNEVTAQLAQKASISYVDAILMDIAKGGPRGLFNSKSALLSTYPTGADGVWLVFDTTFGDGAHSFLWDSFNKVWKDLGIYQGIGASDRSLKQIAIKGLLRIGWLVGSSINFNVDTNVQNITTVSSGGFIVAGTETHTMMNSSFSYSSTSSQTVLVYFQPSTKKIIYKAVSELSDSENDIYLGFIRKGELVSINGNFQLDSSDITTINKKEKTNMLYGMAEGVLTGSPTNFNIDFSTTSIKTTNLGGFVNTKDMSIILAEGTYDYSLVSANTVLVFIDRNTGALEFYKISTLLNATGKVFLGMIRKDSNTCDFNGTYSINGSPVTYLTKSEKTDLSLSQNNVKHTVVEKYDSSIVYTQPLNTVSEVYALYDKLVENDPVHYSRVLFATEESGLPIYMYQYKPTKIANYNFPKIVITAPHPHEKQNYTAMALFFKDMSENWKTKEIYSTLKYGFAIDILPILNPYGLNNNLRTTVNGVDLNRNFPSGFTVSGVGTVNYSGAEPLSEPVSKALFTKMKLEENVVLALDCHNWFTDTSDGVPFWLGSNHEEAKKVCSKATMDFMSVINKKYNDTNRSWSDWVIGTTVQGGITNEWVAQGKQGVIQEIVWSVDGDMEKGQKMNIEFLANTLKTFINNTKI